MLPIETELCAYTVESCRAAARAGMTRVELCASPCEGGTTPSAAAVRMARSIPGLELAVMIRPRGGDFLYTAQEFDQMRLDIEYARKMSPWFDLKIILRTFTAFIQKENV